MCQGYRQLENNRKQLMDGIVASENIPVQFHVLDNYNS